MRPQPYTELTYLQLLELCVWREAQGEPYDGKRAVAHVVRNRVYGTTKWWGRDWESVILHPWQFSSFNKNDPNSRKWPEDTDPSFLDSQVAAESVYLGNDGDLTAGATFYHATSMGWPASWGDPNDYEETLSIGRHKFYRLRTVLPPTRELDVQE